ncbi:VENN motif pre-toxin domain-containing protein [Uruburuella testudinis]|uniref:VENN motif pre-toxin domain-containing protein n=1 Tax=Uruburuella testudinis TaxID=1282863 RepID=A0ABY4DR00_9NEIS|nr:VENN motif pre-toxin domain-containing protein [Uruburuella testudinis]UOO81466.1 VENN motif pre-toxin domain-containing protein [Uruburuella testudinis]
MAGCAAAAANKGKCQDGAIGAAVGEIVAEAYGKPMNAAEEAKLLAISKVAAASAAALAGGDANTAANIAETAVRNNFLSKKEGKKLEELLKKFDKKSILSADFWMGQASNKDSMELLKLLTKDQYSDELLYKFNTGKQLTEYERFDLAAYLNEYGKGGYSLDSLLSANGRKWSSFEQTKRISDAKNTALRNLSWSGSFEHKLAKSISEGMFIAGVYFTGAELATLYKVVAAKPVLKAALTSGTIGGGLSAVIEAGKQAGTCIINNGSVKSCTQNIDPNKVVIAGGIGFLTNSAIGAGSAAAGYRPFSWINVKSTASTVPVVIYGNGTAVNKAATAAAQGTYDKERGNK